MKEAVAGDGVMECGNEGVTLSGQLFTIGSLLREILHEIKEGKKENLPHTPLKEKREENSLFMRARTRVKVAPESNPNRFVKPTVDEVAAYIKEKGYKFDPDAFWNFYESKGWRVGRNPMKSWKAACTTWNERENVYVVNNRYQPSTIGGKRADN